MKTYLLRAPKTVEPQSARRVPRTRPVPAAADGSEVRRYGLIGGTHDDVLRLAKKLLAAHPDTELRFCYEAGPHGYHGCRYEIGDGLLFPACHLDPVNTFLNPRICGTMPKRGEFSRINQGHDAFGIVPGCMAQANA